MRIILIVTHIYMRVPHSHPTDQQVSATGSCVSPAPHFPASGGGESARAIPLSAVAIGQTVIVQQVNLAHAQAEVGDVGLRLLELGFIAGEQLRVVATGFPGREPIAVRIGNTTFALRRFEADHVLVLPADQGDDNANVSAGSNAGSEPRAGAGPNLEAQR